MIRNLKGKLQALAESQSAKPAPRAEEACFVRDEAEPLSLYEGLLDVTDEHARIMTLGEPRPFDIRRTLFLDTETTGLGGAGTVAFLIGVGFVEGERFVTRLILMRDYSQEANQLSLLADMMDDMNWIVSFNGKSFDVPLLRGRFIMQGLRHRWRELEHLDLLHAARRVWKPRLVKCSLQRLERELLGIERDDDLPGAEVPGRFFEYLKTGRFSLLDDVLRHNTQDVRTLARLLVALARTYDCAEEQVDMLDVFALGRSLHRAGEIERARRCFTVASVGVTASQARVALANSYRRQGEWESARGVYESMAERGEGGSFAYIALAILAEHREHDAGKAMTLTREAMRRAKVDEIPELEKRRKRLQRKLGGG
ncbi:MAG: ribonuclease H-like domain-containing protein [Oscillospiraceae bacterium]|jgi:pentatricopeptide repeat protein|nr:ribonuclease H-like domain-containing protein [Oscillospiraceae bacterium]